MNKKSSNIFDILKISTKENFHSKFISSIIEYDKFAKIEFLKMLNSALPEEKIRIDEDLSCIVINEKKLKNNKGRTDIFISDNYGIYTSIPHKGNKRIIIENKIYAKDQSNQMKRYYEYLSEYEGYLFYLTLEGKHPTKYSLNDLKTKDYSILTYRNHIQPWLESVYLYLKKEIPSIGPQKSNIKLMSHIQDYVEIIQRLTIISEMIENGYDEKGDVSLEDYNILLELRFWQYLEENICNGVIPDNRRLYNFEKIKKNYKKSSQGEYKRPYGIIIGDRRIAVEIDKSNEKKFKLYLSKGKFDKNKWNIDGEKIYKINGESFFTNKLVNTSNMKGIADKIITAFNNL